MQCDETQDDNKALDEFLGELKEHFNKNGIKAREAELIVNVGMAAYSVYKLSDQDLEQ